MKKLVPLSLFAVTLIILPGLIVAQDYDYHPNLSDSFSVSLGAMRSSNSFTLESDFGIDIGDEIGFEDSLGVSKNSTFFNGQLRWKFGIGAGLHTLKIKAFIEGEIKIDDETTEFQRGDVDVSQPLPNIGAWYSFSPTKKWLLHGRVDWTGGADISYSGPILAVTGNW